MSDDKALRAKLAALRFKPIVHFTSLFATEKGKPLDATRREEMEEVLGCDFQDVRIYDNHQAGEIARRLNAEAFTIGNRIFAPKGKLNTATLEGKALLSHELTHVIQQTEPNMLGGWREIAQPLRYNQGQNRVRGGATQIAAASPKGASGGPVQRALEAEAQAVERSVREAGSTMSLRAERSNLEAVVIDAEDIADRVYCLMHAELILEREQARV